MTDVAVQEIMDRAAIERVLFDYCSGIDRCTTQDNTWISPGHSASVQCNGVRQWRLYDGNWGKAYCSIELRYR